MKRLQFCSINYAIPYLIVRLKGFWLILLSVVSCLGFLIIFHWPKLQFNVCRITFDTLPYYLTNEKIFKTIKTLDVDVTYYIGPHWELSSKSIIPFKDIPVLDYNLENKMTSQLGTIQTFEYALEKNLALLINFCPNLTSFRSKNFVENIQNQRKFSTNHHHTNTNLRTSNNDLLNE